MKKSALSLAALGAVILVLFSVRNQNAPRPPQARAGHSSNATISAQTRTNLGVGPGALASSEGERFQLAILPIAHDFLKRIAALAPEGVLLPFDLPISVDQVTKLQFGGGPPSTVCMFNLGGHTHFACHVVVRNGTPLKGVNSFLRSGRDADGIPRNFVHLTGDPVANAPYLDQLAKTNVFPVRDLQQTARVAERVLAALRSSDAISYQLTESWREQVGATALPFYFFAFTRSGSRPRDPSNLMRDEILIGFKSTTNGLVLDFFEDNSIAFSGQKAKIR